MAEVLAWFAAVLGWIAAIVGGFIIVLALLMGATVWMLRRRNRVDPRIATHAPLWWLWSVGRCARLHRRLRSAVAHARLRPTARRDTLVAGLTAYACALDQRLVFAGRAPLAIRVTLLGPLAAEVVQVEHLAARLSGAVSGQMPGPAPRGLEAIAERLDALEAARRDLDALDPHTRYMPL